MSKILKVGIVGVGGSKGLVGILIYGRVNDGFDGNLGVGCRIF